MKSRKDVFTVTIDRLNSEEISRRNRLQEEKPHAYEKIIKFDEKIRRGESIAIIQLQYSYACNMICQHCSVKSIQDQKRNHRRVLTPDDVRELARQADEYGLARFEINGGEPFVNKNYDDIVKAIDPQKFYINTVTNGWLLDERRAKHLKDIGVDRVQVGIDSLSAEEHDSFRRRKGAHSRALQAVEACRKAGLGVFVTTVVTKQRLYSSEFREFVTYFNDKGVGVFMTFAKPVGAWQGRYDLMIAKDDLAYARELEKTHNIFSHLTSGYGIEGGCLAISGLIGVTPYGDVMPCQYIFISLGNIFEESLKTILERGMRLKPFKTSTCPIAEDMNFIEKYIVKKVYDKPLPVPYTEVFTEEDYLMSAPHPGTACTETRRQHFSSVS
jgi:MoaA/NifB/PqqE/SkfB family radical SAM enzyme